MPIGKYPRTPEHNKKISEATKGKRKHLIGRPVSQETREKIAASQRGVPRKKHTEEWKAAQSARMTGQKRDPEIGKKISATKQANPYTYTDEQRAKMSEGPRRYQAALSYEERVALHANWIELMKTAQRNMPRNDTSIELYVAEFLRQMGVEFEHPYQAGAMQADFYIPAINTLVEVQGCYWHGCEQCGFTGNEFFALKRKRDRNQFGYFKGLGYKIRTIWEHEIRDNILDNLMKLVPQPEET